MLALPFKYLTSTSPLFLLVIVFAVAAGCAGNEPRSEGARKGAATGALVGLTMGALTGDASLAAAGAVARRRSSIRPRMMSLAASCPPAATLATLVPKLATATGRLLGVVVSLPSCP